MLHKKQEFISNEVNFNDERRSINSVYTEELKKNHEMMLKSNSISAFMYELMLDCLAINEYIDLDDSNAVKILNDTFVEILDSHKYIISKYMISEQMIAHFMIYTINNLRPYKIEQYESRGVKFQEDCTYMLKGTGTDFIQSYCDHITHSGIFNINTCLDWLSILQMVKIPIYFRFPRNKISRKMVSSETITNIREFISEMIIFDYSISNVLNIKELYCGYKLYTDDESIDFKTFRNALIEIGLIGSGDKYIRNVRYTRNGDSLFNLILPATKENELMYD